MSETLAGIVAVTLTFVLAGVVKGAAGMGLPTVAMGVLGIGMAPREAAALVVIPSLVTNVWQYFSGARRLRVLSRTWSMLTGAAVTTWAACGLLAGQGNSSGALWLGAALVAYAAATLANFRIRIPSRYEIWLSPAAGAITGLVTGATGVFVIPAVPYLQALGFEGEELIQSLGLSFTVSTLALAGGLAGRGAFRVSALAASTLCTLPALAGMGLGQLIRSRVNARVFRRLFLICLLGIGAELIGRGVFCEPRS
ncbi:MAG TPA: sulfite exporter TauE/SafE family protein [Steroidobacteraceae bacterium]|jgi:uncharacterized membrane protein YfcA|nr:sulfite exporter TauE/SafE family protein [Steroidobacteraceae bacterium]